MVTVTTLRMASVARTSLFNFTPNRMNCTSSINESQDQASSYLYLSNQTNAYLPKHFYQFRKNEDIFKNYQDFIDELKNSEDKLSRTELYVLIQKTELLLKLVKDHYVCYINYDKIAKDNTETCMSLKDFYELVKTMYDPCCIDNEEGFKLVWDNDRGFRENFIKKFGSDNFDEILSTFVINSNLNTKRYNECLLFHDENGLTFDDEIFRRESRRQYLLACLEGYNKSYYLTDLLSKTCDEDITKPRQEYFLKEHQRLIVEAMKCRPFHSALSSKDCLLDAYITIENLCNTLQEKSKQFLKLHQSNFKSAKNIQTVKELLDRTRRRYYSMPNDTKEGFKDRLINDKKAHKIFALKFEGNIVDELPDLAEKLWYKVLIDDYKLRYHGGYTLIIRNYGFFTKEEIKFLKCCAQCFRITLYEIPSDTLTNSKLFQFSI